MSKIMVLVVVENGENKHDTMDWLMDENKAPMHFETSGEAERHLKKGPATPGTEFVIVRIMKTFSAREEVIKRTVIEEAGH